jgi:hypothetical protein
MGVGAIIAEYNAQLAMQQGGPVHPLQPIPPIPPIQPIQPIPPIPLIAPTPPIYPDPHLLYLLEFGTGRSVLSHCFQIGLPEAAAPRLQPPAQRHALVVQTMGYCPGCAWCGFLGF